RTWASLATISMTRRTHSVLGQNQHGLLARPLPCALAKQHQLVRGLAGECLLRSVRPDNVNAVDPFCCPQPEMGPRIVAAQITVTRIDAPHPAVLAGLDGNFGAVRVSLESRIHGPNHEPVASLRRHIAVEPGRTGNLCDEQVQGAVVVDVSASQSTRN